MLEAPRQPALLQLGGQGTAEAKIAALESAGVTVVRSPAEMGVAMQATLGASC